jgi:restriction endonuclease Mrr
MPKDTGRGRQIRAVLAQLLAQQSVWNVRQLRKACLGKLDVADAKDRQKYVESIRRTVIQMQSQGELIAQGDDGVTLNTAENAAEGAAPESGTTAAAEPTPDLASDHAEIANEHSSEPLSDLPQPGIAPAALPNPGETAEAAPEPEPIAEKTEAEPTATPAPEASEIKPEKTTAVKMPKAKHMNQFLIEALRPDEYLTEEMLVDAAVERFGVSGKQINGVKGLVVQRLKEMVKDEEAELRKGSGYRRKPISEITLEPEAAMPKEEAPSHAAPEEPSREKQAKTEKKPAPQAEKKTGKAAEAAPARAEMPKKKARKQDPSEPKAAPLTKKESLPRSAMNENRYAEKLNKCGGAFFAEYVARLFDAHFSSRKMKVRGRYVVDGADDKGVDVVLHTVDELGFNDVILLQAKTRSSGQVTLKEIREFFGVMSAERATRGIFVTTATFTTDAIAFVRSNPSLAAVDKHKLFELAREHRLGLISDGEVLLADPAVFD